jgi:hypothetical protein
VQRRGHGSRGARSRVPLHGERNRVALTGAFAVHVSFEACNVLFPKSVAFSSFVIAIDGQGESAHTLVVTVKMQKLEIIYS